MGCFDNIIGVGCCEEETPSSGIYLKDTGISNEDLGLLFGSDYKDGYDLANDKIRVATRLVINELSTNFSSAYKNYTLLEDQRVGYFQENKPTKAGADEIRGIDLLLKNYDSYLSLYIDKVQIHINYTGNISLKVWDVVQNKVLDTFTVAVTAGEITDYTINKTYTSDRKKLHLVVGYNANGITSYETSLTDSAGCTTCSLGSYQNMNSYLQAKSVYVSSTTVIDQNIFGLSHTSGLSLLYSLKCNHEEWMCKYKNEIAPAIAYKACAEIVQYGLYQKPRANNRVFDVDTLKERWNLYDSLYRKYMKNLMENISIPNDSKCFQCKEITRSRITLP